MASLEIHTGARKRVYELLDDEVSIGPEGDIRVPGLSGSVCVRVARGGHVLAAQPAVVVNGESVQQRSLEHGDRIELPGAELVYIDPSMAVRQVASRPRQPAETRKPVTRGVHGQSAQSVDAQSAGAQRVDARRSAAKRAETRRPEVHRPEVGRTGTPRPPVRRSARREAEPDERRGRSARRRRRGMPRWMLMWNIALVTLVLGWVAVRTLGSKDMVREPDDLIALAETQARTGRFDDALASLARADTRSPDSSQRRRMSELREEIDRRVRRIERMTQLEAARRSYRPLTQFVDRHLQTSRRPAARVFVPMAQEWLRTHREVCEEFDDTRELVHWVEDQVAIHAPNAELESPATAEDVVFAAERQSRIRPRRWVVAIGLLDDWLRDRGDGEDAKSVVALRADLVEKGRAWTNGELLRVDGMERRGETQRAIQALEHLMGDGALPEWRDGVAERLTRLKQ